MRKIRRLAAAVTALALTGSILTCSGVSGQMRDAQVRETTIIGDVSAAAGITIRFGSGIGEKLSWLQSYTFGDAAAQTVKYKKLKYNDVQFEAESETYVPDLTLTAAENAVDYDTIEQMQELAEKAAAGKLNAYDEETLALTKEFFTADAQQKLQELDARLPKAGSASLAAGEEAAITIKMNELLRYYPISGTASFESDVNESLDLTSGIFARPAEGNSLWTDFNRFFRIPMPENESMGYRVTRFSESDDTLYPEPSGWTVSTKSGEDHFAFAMISCAADDAIYFTFDPHTENGKLVDLSRIPGGYGIYRLPYDRERKIFLGEKLEMVYALDPELRYVGLTVSPDGRKLLLQRQECVPLEPGTELYRDLTVNRTEQEENEVDSEVFYEATLTAETIDLASRKAEETQEVLRGLDSINFRNGGDYLVFSDGVSRLCVLAYEDGRYRKTLSLADLQLDGGLTDETPCYWILNRMAYDGERLVLAGMSYVSTEETGIGGWDQDRSGGVDVAVYNADGLACFGRLYSNLQEWTDDRSFTDWMERIRPNKQGQKNYYTADRFNTFHARTSWLAIEFAQEERG